MNASGEWWWHIPRIRTYKLNWFSPRRTTEEGNLQQPGHLAAAGAMLDSIICEDSIKCRKQWAWKALKTPEFKK